ncbi:unnamed protein product [Calicophoron daubneyi]
MVGDSTEEFNGYYEKFMSMLSSMDRPSEAGDYFQKVAAYNLDGGKRIRGALVGTALKAFGNDECKPEIIRSAHLTGWCIEMLHAGFLILDDIMDDSPKRRGKPSWFSHQRAAGRGLIAINDGLHLVLCAKSLLHQIFSSYPEQLSAYSRIIKIFDMVAYNTCWGQNLDTNFAQSPNPDSSIDLTVYSKANFDSITRWKTGFYTFYLPVACGMALAGVEDEQVYADAEKILLKLGQYFQAQDDYLDCFGEVEETGKIGTDISDGKCSWLIVECLSRASPKQIEVVKKFYGRKGDKAASAIRELYEELGLPAVFRNYEMKMRAEINQDIENWRSIDNHPEGSCTLFSRLVEMLFLRSR